MKKIIAIIAGEPNSINSEIIAKTWKKKKNFKNLNIFVIGNYFLIKKQLKSLGFKLKLKKINELKNQNFKKNLLIYDVPLSFKNPFKVPIENKSKYIIRSFDTALAMFKKKSLFGLINCPIDKKETFGKKFSGITEFLAKKENILGKEVMLIYNKQLSVSPITTHMRLKKVPNSISKNKIIKKITIINNFFLKIFKIKPKIGVLGLNPHNNEMVRDSEEVKIIIPAIKQLKRKKISVFGPISPDTSFMNFKKKKFNVLVGMYHDQVLSPFKSIFKFDAINITLGISFLRISPDHGIGKEIVKKNIANPKSLLESIKFFKKINVKT